VSQAESAATADDSSSRQPAAASQPAPADLRRTIRRNVEAIGRAADELREVHRAADMVREHVGGDDAYVRPVLEMTANLARLIDHTNRLLAVYGVEHDAISRRLAGELLGVHQGTIARWLKEPLSEPQFTTPLYDNLIANANKRIDAQERRPDTNDH
jgi:hypothetical protein